MKRFCVVFLFIMSLLSHINADKCEFWIAKIVQNDTFVCHSATINFDVIVRNDSINLDSCKYEWFVQIPGGGFISQGINRESSFSFLFSQSGVYHIMCKVTPDTCDYITSDTISVSVYSILTPGVIFGNDTICYNSQPNEIQSVSLPTGCDGQYVYQWQDSVSGGPWRDIPNSNSVTYQAGNLIETTFFRRNVTNIRCGVQVFSTPVCVKVRNLINAPVISQYMDTICYDSIPSSLSIIEPSIAGIGDTVRYQWQDSIIGGNWTNIQNATNLQYQPSALQTTHFYRVVATSDKGCGTFTSNVTGIVVFEDLQISVQTPQVPLCYSTSSDITISATGAGGEYLYQWQDSINGIWNNVGMNDSIYHFEADSVGVRYLRCKVVSVKGCSYVFSPVIVLNVYSELDAGSITLSRDTICYGTKPDLIQSENPASGCDGIFTYSWEKSIDGEYWNSIPNSNNASFQPPVLMQNTYYRRKVHNAYCNVAAYTNYLLVIVRQDLTVPVIGQYLDTICFNAIPDLLEIVTPSTCGVGDTVRYQWQDSVAGETWNNINGATGLTCQPTSLTDSRYYRVVATSEKGCGMYASNTVKINVYPDLTIVNNQVDTICYMTSAQLTFTATGEGGRYSYQWQESSDSITFTDIRNEKRSDYWTDDKPNGKYYYRCIVTPKNGCPADTSDVFVVNVYKELRAGKIGSDQKVCKNDDAAELTFITLPDGGDTNRYSYQWEYSVDMTDWYNVTNETSKSYTPRNMQQTTYYRVKVRNSCGLDYTDTVEIFVNPLPDTVIISGNQYVCYNKYELYEIPEMITGFDYQWSLDNSNAGEIITNPNNESQVRVLWIDANSNANITLTVINTETGCLSRNYYPVTTSNEMTPDTTIIIRKPNSNIFVCQDSITDHYRWGSTEKSSGNETMFENSDRRYCQVEGGIDITKYIYWLDLWNGDTSRCTSRSIYMPSNDDKYIHQPKQNIRVVSSINDYISFEIDNPSSNDVNVVLYTVAGIKLMNEYLGNNSVIKAHLPVDVPAGVYILRVEIGIDCETFKLIAE